MAAISQVNLGAPNISSGSAYHPYVAEDFRLASSALANLDHQVMQAEWQRAASEQYARDVMSYSNELQELRTKTTDPAQFQIENDRLARKYLYENDKELSKSMHPKALALYKQSMQPYVMQNFQRGQEDAFKARAQNAVSGLLNAIDTNIADAAAQGIDGINLKDHVKQMEDNINALPSMYVDREKVRTEKRQHLFRALGETFARDHPMEALERISPTGAGLAPEFSIKLPLSNPTDGSPLIVQEDILRMDPLMNQHLYTIAIQSLEKQHTMAMQGRANSEYMYKLDSERQFGKAVSRIISGERGVASELSTQMVSFRAAFPSARPALDGGQLNSLREMENSVQEKKAKGTPTTKAGYAKALDRITRGDPSYDEIAGMDGLSSEDAMSLMGKLATEKQRSKDESYTHYKMMRNEAEDQLRALVLAKNPMAAFGEINPMAEMLVAKLRDKLDEKEVALQASKAPAGSWRREDMNPKTIAMQLMIDQEPMLKQQFVHDSEKLISTLVQYMPSGKGMTYKDMSQNIQSSHEPAATKKMMLALLYQARAQEIPERQFDAAMKIGVIPGKAGKETRRETFLEWFKGLFPSSQQEKKK